MGRVVSQDELILRRSELKRNGKSVVFASGRFDLLHPGHTRLLEQARANGDVLIVAIEIDESASQQNAREPARQPQGSITLAAERAEILAALAAVDYVIECNPTSVRELIALLAPEVVVRGGEPGSDQAAFRDDEAAATAGIKVVRIPLEPGHSTARLIERIKTIRA